MSRPFADPTQGRLDPGEIVDLLRMFYTSEVYGAAANALMLQAYEGLTADHRRKLEACRLLMLETGERLRTHILEAFGVDAPAPTRAQEMAQLIAVLRQASWDQRMRSTEAVCARGLDAYRRLRAMYGQAQPRLCASLVAKEIAMRDFARDEVEGDGDRSLERIVTLLGPDSRRDLAAFEV